MFKKKEYHKQLVALTKVEKLCKKKGIEEFIFVFKDGDKLFDCEAVKDKSFMAKLWSMVDEHLGKNGKRLF